MKRIQRKGVCSFLGSASLIPYTHLDGLVPTIGRPLLTNVFNFFMFSDLGHVTCGESRNVSARLT